jgi:hypothetical protein
MQETPNNRTQQQASDSNPGYGLAIPTIPPQHYDLKKRKKSQEIRQSHQGFDDPGELPRYKDDKSNAQEVGAFAVAGNGGSPSGQVSSSLRNSAPSNIEGSTEYPIVAHVVDEEKPPLPASIFDAIPLEESEPTEAQHLKALLNSRKCRIISALALALVVGVIVAVVVLTQNSSKAVSGSETQAPINDDAAATSDEFLVELKSLLSNGSMAALDIPNSPQNQSLQWLLGSSNFQDLSFHRQVQRYAMATIYYATGGRSSWSNAGGNWLTDESECKWVQGSQGYFCGENDALLMLKQRNNMLNGTIPDEIRLLSSLVVIDLTMNQITGTLSSELGLLTALTNLYLDKNAFTGTVPSELGSLKALKWLNVGVNQLTGTVPTELGSLTALTFLSLGTNAMRGTVPTELGSLISLTELYIDKNSFTGTVPSELGLLTALKWSYLSDTFLNGTVPDNLCILGSPEEVRVDCSRIPQCSCCSCSPS